MEESLVWPECELKTSGCGLTAFQHLCKKCDRDSLFWLLLMLKGGEINSDTAKCIPPEVLRREGSDRVSWAALDEWRTATDSLQPAELRRITHEAQRFIDRIKRLRATPFVHMLAMSGEIRVSDLLNWRCNLDEKFATLLRLPELAEAIGPRQRSDRNETLDALTKYVEDRWGRPMSTSVGEVLNGLGISVDLKQRRFDRKRAASRKNKTAK